MEFRRRLLASDAYIIAPPEYNASMPGTIKNLVDWTSRFRPQPFDTRHGKLIEPERVASVVALLFTDDAQAINGTTVPVDDGFLQFKS